MYYVSVMIEVPPTLAVCTIIKFGQDDFVAPGMDFFLWPNFLGRGTTNCKTPIFRFGAYNLKNTWFVLHSRRNNTRVATTDHNQFQV